MNLAIGPILIVVGMVLLELISFNMSGKGVSDALQKRVERMGIWGADKRQCSPGGELELPIHAFDTQSC